VGALCKTLVFENKGVEAVAAGGDVRAPLAQQRFLAVIVQYAAKLNLAALGKALGGGARLELAAEGRALTGYEHNAVTHLGALTPLPVVLAREVAECGSAYIFLGGGQEDVKARVFLKPLAAQPGVCVLPISEARPEEEWES
jgi:prolyl-tRNA editing enzyme YbaK/EbsC (Cys-tRNA(Pro) deacylase)